MQGERKRKDTIIGFYEYATCSLVIYYFSQLLIAI